MILYSLLQLHTRSYNRFVPRTVTTGNGTLGSGPPAQHYRTGGRDPLHPSLVRHAVYSHGASTPTGIPR
jgi:hypothetical protein